MFRVRLHDTKSLRWWYLHRDEIDFEPPYQRKGKLWSTIDKAYLIDSILNDFDIPKLYLADFNIVNTSLNKHNRPYAIIDGRQRFEAIIEFFGNDFALLDDFKYYAEPKLELGGLTYRDLRNNYPQVAEKLEE